MIAMGGACFGPDAGGALTAVVAGAPAAMLFSSSRLTGMGAEADGVWVSFMIGFLSGFVVAAPIKPEIAAPSVPQGTGMAGSYAFQSVSPALPSGRNHIVIEQPNAGRAGRRAAMPLPLRQGDP